MTRRGNRDGYGGTWREIRETRTCIVCGAEFETTRSAIYCSEACARKAQNRREYIARKARQSPPR